jgi:site-specific DNA-methyltransferase (adenine-specific)
MDKFINKVIMGDCLQVMKGIPDKSVDMILADLPIV